MCGAAGRMRPAWGKFLMLSPLRFVMRQLVEPGRSIWTYIGKVWLIGICGEAIVGVLATLLLPDGRTMPLPGEGEGAIGLTATLVLLMVVVPIQETIVLVLAVWIIRRITPDVLLTAIVTGIFAGLLHAYSNSLANGFATTWGFFAMTMALQVGAVASWWRGAFIALAVHMLNNGLVVALLAASGYFGNS